MRHFVQSGLIASLVVGFAAVAAAQAPKTGQPDPKTAAKTAVPPRPAMLDQVLATVNGEPIIRDELYRILEATGTPPGASINEDRSIYQMTIEQLVNKLLLKQYLKKQAALVVSEAEIDKDFATFADQFKKDGQDVNVALATHGVSVAQVRDDMATVIRYRKYIEAVANDANLKKFVADNKDVFDRNQVKASHILVQLEPTATPADKEKAKQKLLAIKLAIESNKISFADAANKYSEDDSNKASPRGGDIGYFERKGIIEPFAAAAFAMKPGTISNVVETPFGMHLIQVTDRKEGTPIKFEENKILIRNEYAADLSDRIIALERKTAKIKIESMPADFFPKTQPPATATTPADPAKTATPGKAASPR
jgi:peptidyl-prolyl cis-trans isomerase C